MAKDSRLWEEAYKSLHRRKNYWASQSKKKGKSIVVPTGTSFQTCNDSPELSALRTEQLELDEQIRNLLSRRDEVRERIKAYRFGNKPWKLYALRLEHDCWYIGITRNVNRRFGKHKQGKGANWTALHEPIEIVEVRDTKCITESAAIKLENDMTLEYVIKYGKDKVRGGGYCQAKPHWPIVD